MDNSNLIEISPDSKSLQFLYGTKIGRIFLRILIAPWISKVVGAFLSSGLSKGLIKKFIESNNINVNDYEDCEYKNFNSFFCRKILPELRPYDLDTTHFVSPCDGLLSVYKIEDDLIVPVKQSRYSIKDLLQDDEVSDDFRNGICFVFRLCVNHYHRYDYCETGNIILHKKISGKLHTVRPIALRNGPIFCENSREYDVIETKNCGKIIQMEVGAMLVGKIDNNVESGAVVRGTEKGKFLYGGSTIIVLTQKDKVNITDDYFNATKESYEIPVKMGQQLGIINN